MDAIHLNGAFERAICLSALTDVNCPNGAFSTSKTPIVHNTKPHFKQSKQLF